MSRKYPLLNDRAWLNQKYWIEKLSHQQIAQIIGCSRHTVWYAFRLLNIPSRTISEACKGDMHHNYGKHYSDNRKQRMSVERKNKGIIYPELNDYDWLHHKYWVEELSCADIAEIIGCCLVAVWRALKRLNIPRRALSEIKGFWKGKHLPEATKAKMREARKHRIFPKHHTSIELIFEEICKRNKLPFRYVGDGQLWIGGKRETQLNPDFIECNGEKIAIFINGDYWHSPLLRYNIRDSQRVDYQAKICKRYKWKAIILWESDLKRPDTEQFVLSVLKKEGCVLNPQ